MRLTPRSATGSAADGMAPDRTGRTMSSCHVSAACGASVRCLGSAATG
jgi:hypothetical protein